MANENQNTGPNTQGPDRGQTKQTISDIKEIKREQGDFNDAIKDSINLLRQLDRSYERIESRLETMNKSTINIKEINQELAKAKQKEFSTTRQLSEAQKSISADSKNRVDQYLKSQAKINELEARKIQYLRQGNQQSANGVDLLLTQYTALNERQKNTLNVQEAELIALMQANQIAKQSVVYGQEKLAEEKRIQSQLGVTGTALKLLNKYLLVGKNLHEKMVEEARNGESSTKKWVAGVAILSAAVYGVYQGMKKFADVAKSGLDNLTGSGGPVSKFVSPFTNLVKQLPFIGGLLGGLVDLGANLIDFTTGATSKIEEFGRNLGIPFSQAKAINAQFEQIARNSGQAFLTVEKLTNSQLELSQALGVNTKLNDQILQDNIQLQEQVGLELDTRKQLAQVAIIANTRQTQIFKTITGQVEAVRRSVGVNLRVQDIISKISQLSGVVGLTFAKYPEKLTKSLAITKALGLDFQKLDSIASGLLDFESSLAAEFEAQLITGKDINLAKARQLALDNDLTGLAVELNKQLGSSEEFINMNRIAQESYSKALGMSRDEIADMLRQQEFFAAIGAKDLKTFKEKVAQMEKAGTLQRDFVSKLSEEQAQYFLSSTATEKIASFMEKIRQSFASLLSSDQFKSFLDNFLNKLSDPNFLTGIINKLTDFVSTLIKGFAALIDSADYIANKIPFSDFDIPDNISRNLKSYANSLGGISIGGAVANSQAGPSTMGGGATSTPTQSTSSPEAINLTVQAFLKDHAQDAEIRMKRPPKIDIKTGAFGK